MSRFYDRILEDGIHPPPPARGMAPVILADLQRATVVKIDNVARWFYAGTDQENWIIARDFPVVLSPFEDAWYEWHHNGFVRSEEHGDHWQPPTTMGFLVRVFERGDYTQVFERDIVQAYKEERGLEIRPRWIQETLAFIDGGKGKPARGPVGAWRVPITADGTPCVRNAEEAVYEMFPLAAHGRSPEIVKAIEKGLISSIYPMYMAISLMHCFGGETKVITKDGPKPIRDLAASKVELITRGDSGRGVWRESTVLPFGRQQIWKLLVKRNGQEKLIRTTADHRWFVRTDGRLRSQTEQLTRNLAPGDSLVTIRPGAISSLVGISAMGVAHGYTYGDGGRNDHQAYVDIHDGKPDDILRYFPSPRITTVKRDNKEWPRINGLPRSFKELPRKDEGVAYLYSFLAGWFAADGSVGAQGQLTLWCVDRDALEWAQGIGAQIGVVVSEPKVTPRAGYGSEPSEIWYSLIDRGTVSSEFFIRSAQKTRYETMAVKPEPNHWKVVEVEETQDWDDVYCAVVPETESFVLDGYILTGNCKNVTRVAHEIPDDVQKKRFRKKRPALSRYYTLEIDALKEDVRAQGGAKSGGFKRAIHQRRGHFKHYTPERPLFGKHVGRWFWANQLVGTPEIGSVEKDYAVKGVE